jgi:hypothetical protein
MSIFSCLSCVHLPMLMVSDPASEGVHSLARFSPITVVVDDGVPYSPGIKKILFHKSGTLPGLFQDRLFLKELLLMSMVSRLTLASTRYGLNSLELCQNRSGIEPVPWNSRASTNDAVKERWCPAPLLFCCLCRSYATVYLTSMSIPLSYLQGALKSLESVDGSRSCNRDIFSVSGDWLRTNENNVVDP